MKEIKSCPTLLPTKIVFNQKHVILWKLNALQMPCDVVFKVSSVVCAAVPVRPAKSTGQQSPV